MANVKKNEFEILYQGSVAEYEGENQYIFYNIDEDFHFRYNVEDYEFTKKCDMNLSDTQLNTIEAKILEKYREDQDEENYVSNWVSPSEDLETYGQYEY